MGDLAARRLMTMKRTRMKILDKEGSKMRWEGEM
jgi:hypothetical protein